MPWTYRYLGCPAQRIFLSCHLLTDSPGLPMSALHHVLDPSLLGVESLNPNPDPDPHPLVEFSPCLAIRGPPGPAPCMSPHSSCRSWGGYGKGLVILRTICYHAHDPRRADLSRIPPALIVALQFVCIPCHSSALRCNSAIWPWTGHACIHHHLLLYQHACTIPLPPSARPPSTTSRTSFWF